MATKSGNAIGRPKAVFDRAKVAQLRDDGRSWREIAGILGVGVGTVLRVHDAGVPKPSPISSAFSGPSERLAVG
jgi:hypothetical protein